jgi:Zn-dependent peptidase ImmA (M78 family)
MRGVHVPITPSVLSWAIEESGYSLEALADRVRISTKVLEAWLEGEEQPGLTQFRRLATVLKRTPSALLLAKRPERSRPVIKFRRPAGERRTELSPEERRYIREATRIQRILSWVLKELGQDALSLPREQMDSDAEEVALYIRKDLGVSEADQVGWKSGSEAFASWRSILEAEGILVFLLPLGSSSCRGFSLWDERAPVVTVNTAFNIEARIYSLFHEFGHLITRTNSACLENGVGRTAPEAEDRIERWCESFSASVLMPRAFVRDALQQFHRNPRSLECASFLANRFKVSLRAAVIRLIELRIASWDLYREIPRAADQKPERGGGRGRRRLQLREDHFGHRTTQLFVEALRKDVLSRTDILGILNIADTDLDQLQLGRH